MAKKQLKKTALILMTLMWVTACKQAPTREEIVAKYPDVDAGGSREENKEILCPFVRMLERSGIFDDDVSEQQTLTVAASSVGRAAQEFGCGFVECNTVANLVAAGQSGGGMVHLDRLHEASGIAHDCGLTFELGGTQVSDTVRDATLDRLAELANAEGQLIYDDLLQVKQEICQAQGVSMSAAGETETKLIFAYLGGVERGFVMVDDVDRLLHAQMPLTKTSAWVNASLLSKVQPQ